jgi:hypothetical protein
MAKERDSRHYRHRHRRASHHRSHRRPRPSGAHGDVSIPIGRYPPQPPQSHQAQYFHYCDTASYTRSRSGAERARSTSPNSRYPAHQFSFSAPAAPPLPATAHHSPAQAPTRSPSPQPLGSKRTANAAFSPTTAHYPDRRPVKQQRPTGISLHIPDSSFAALRGTATAAMSGSSDSPMESSLQSFAHMSLGGSSPCRPYPHAESERPAWSSAVTSAVSNSTPSMASESGEAMSACSSNGSEDGLPHTLVAPYRASERLPSAAPRVSFRHLFILGVHDY